MFLYYDSFLKCSHWWTVLTLPKMFDNSRDLWPFETLTSISDNWEPEFMTIFVIWQLRVTLDIIRYSCNIYILTLYFILGSGYSSWVSNVDLSNVDLSNVDFSNVDFSNVDFSNVDLWVDPSMIYRAEESGEPNPPPSSHSSHTRWNRHPQRNANLLVWYTETQTWFIVQSKIIVKYLTV